MAIPTISTDRLILRPLTRADALDLYAYAQDEQVARSGMWEPFASQSECTEYVARLVADYERGLMWWALEHRADGRVVGRVQLSDWTRGDARAELSYALHRSYWGQGLMTETVAPAVAYGWHELELHRLGAVVLPYNTASIRILERLGMRREGTLRHHRRLWGEWVDVDVYAVLKDDEITPKA